MERPASVVKELVENALDAGATRVAVEIEDGGRQLIRVTDDGCGMSAEELRLAVVPHATSKIVVEDDLYAIGTLGFRGEALASIASVAKLRMVSRNADSVEGSEVRVAADKLELCQAAGSPPGTTVEVRDLFFNVPARRKFLRGASTEAGHLHEQLARVALAFPGVAFELRNNKRTVLNLPATTQRLERIARVYSDELAAALLHVGRQERSIGIDAYVAPPAHSRATAQWQYAFVNGRYIRDRFIQHAIKEAYRGLMEPNRHGVVFLFITVDPRDVDVNVHPTKIEVRWADSGLVHSHVLSALRETFQRCDLTPSLRSGRAADPADPAEQDRIRHDVAAMLKAAAPIIPPRRPDATWAASHAGDAAMRPSGSTGTGAPGPTVAAETAGGAPYGLGRGASPPSVVDASRLWRSLYAPPDSAGPVNSNAPSDPDRGGNQMLHPEPRPRAIQLHNLYLVAETDDGIVIVDQHALHERIMYEQLKARVTHGPLESQRLLLPETLPVTPQQVALIEANGELLARLGIEATPFGTDSLAVHAFPALLKDTDVVAFMRDLLDFLAHQAAATSTEVVIHKVLDMMACKAAVKAGDPLSDEEIEALLRQRHLVDKSGSCPHGRPTTLRFSKAELDRQFKRT